MPLMTMNRMSTARAATLVAALSFCATAAITTAEAQSGSDSNALLARAMQRYGAARTVDIAFTQVVSNPLTQHSLTSRGQLQRQRPNLLSVSFSSPAADRIVDDGNALWVYLPSSAPGQVLKLPAAGAQGILLDPLGQILSTPLSEYAVTNGADATIRGRATHTFTLAPHSTHALFTRATLWIDDTCIVRQLEATEPSGLVRRVTITQFRTNVSIPRSAFHFTPPEGIRIVDQAGRVGSQ